MLPAVVSAVVLALLLAVVLEHAAAVVLARCDCR